MTENEAKQWLKHTRAYQYKCDNCECIDINGACNEECKDFYDMAIQALEEIQAYRAIGTVEGFERAIKSSIENYNLYREYKAKVQEFETIGTIEEFKALKDCGTHDCIIKHLSGECSYKETGCSNCKSKWKIKDLLEKSVEKKAIVYGRNDAVGTDVGLCPVCNDRPLRACDNQYCPDCGQKLDWQ